MLTVGITSAGSGVGSAVLRSLALARLETRIVSLDGAPDATGLHRGHRARVIPRAQAPGYAEAILDVCREEGIQALIPGLDTELEPLAEMAGRLREIGCQLLSGSPEPIRLLRDKLRCFEHFSALGLPFVPTVPLARVEDLLGTHGFPLLVKPLGGSGSRGVYVLFDRRELDKLLADDAVLGGEPFIAQPYLVPTAWGKRKADLRHGDVYANHALVQKDEHMVQVLVDRDRRPFGVMASRNSLKDGAISRMQPLKEDATTATGVALAMAADLAEMGLVGPCNFQCRVTEDGPFVYEVNPRFSGGTGGRASLGFNEVEACLRRLVLGESLEEAQGCLRTDYGRICAWHPMELVMERDVIDRLAQGQAVASVM